MDEINFRCVFQYAVKLQTKHGSRLKLRSQEVDGPKIKTVK